jgi:hypothetical protein
MQRWEYLFVYDRRWIFPASHRLQQVYQYLHGSLPHLKPKDLKIFNNTGISCEAISLVDLMNLLGADGWEVVGVDTATTETIYVSKRPTG